MGEFTGTVFLKEMILTGGQWTNVISGRIKCVEAKEYLGFSVARHEANWFANVKLNDGSELAIFGCQIRGFAKAADQNPPKL